MNWKALARFHFNPLRLQILRDLTPNGRQVLSVEELSLELREELDAVGARLRALHRAGLVTLAKDAPVRDGFEEGRSVEVDER